LTHPGDVGEVRDLLIEALEKANCPIRDVEIIEPSDEVSELSATLVSISLEPQELDTVAASLETSPVCTENLIPLRGRANRVS
jgi:hypothetical protein